MEGIAMGKVVGAALLAHVPTIMLPEIVRKDLNHGQEISLVPGLKRLRKEVFEVLDYDTVIVLDSHWATTVEFVITSAAERSGLFTSEELPRGMTQIPYYIKGDPELANLISKYDEKNGTWITPIADPHLPIFYATLNRAWNYSIFRYLLRQIGYLRESPKKSDAQQVAAEQAIITLKRMGFYKEPPLEYSRFCEE